MPEIRTRGPWKFIIDKTTKPRGFGKASSCSCHIFIGDDYVGEVWIDGDDNYHVEDEDEAQIFPINQAFAYMGYVPKAAREPTPGLKEAIDRALGRTHDEPRQ